MDGKNSEDITEEEDIVTNVPIIHVIGNKDVKVFLNFSWADGSLPKDDPQIRNLTGKIMEALNSGVGYLIVPDGEEHEEAAENTVHLVQTVMLDQLGNIDINTSIPSLPDSPLSQEDLEYIREVELKTTMIILDIFNQMEENFEFTSSTEKINSKLESLTEIISGNDLENDSTTITNKNQVTANTNSSDEEIKTRKPTLVITVDFENLNDKIDPGSLLNGSLASTIEEDLGLRTVLLTKERFSTLAPDSTDIILQGRVNQDGKVKFDIVRNDSEEEGLKSEEKIIQEVSNIVNENIQSLVNKKSQPSEKVKHTNDPNDILLNIHNDTLKSYSNTPGLVVINSTDLSDLLNDPDTLLIGKNIAIGPDEKVTLTTAVGSPGSLSGDISQIPEEIQNAVLEAVGGVVINTDQESSILINVIDSKEALSPEMFLLAKRRLESSVEEATSLSVYTVDSNVVPGPVYYVKLEMDGNLVKSSNVYYNTVPLEDLETERKVKAKIINDLVRLSWDAELQKKIKIETGTQDETTKSNLGKDNLTYKSKTPVEHVIFVDVDLTKSDIPIPSKDNLESFIKKYVETQTGIRTNVTIDATESELKEKIENFTDYYYVPFTVDRFNNIIMGDSINRLSSDGINNENIDSVVLNAVKDSLVKIEDDAENIKNVPSSPTQITPQKSDTDTDTNRLDQIFINVLLPDSHITEREKETLKKYLLNSLQPVSEIKIEVLLNFSEAEVGERLSEADNFYYIPVTVDEFNNVLKGNQINTFTTEDINKEEIDSILVNVVKDGLGQVNENTLNEPSSHSGTDSSYRILINIVLPSSEITERKEETLKSSIKTKLESETGIKTEVVLNLTEAEIEEKIGDKTDYYYIPVIVDRSNNVVKGESINKLTTGDINDGDIDDVIESSVEYGLVKVEEGNDNKTSNSVGNHVTTLNITGRVDVIILNILLPSLQISEAKKKM